MQDNKFNHVMIDLETLGQEPGSVIVTISAVQFNIETGQIGEIFDQSISIESNLNSGLKIDPETFKWWLTRGEQARYDLVEKLNIGKDLDSTLIHFSHWFSKINQNKNTLVWGRGPRFDFGLLTYAYKNFGYPIPWNFRNELCVRTMEWLRPELKKEAIREKEHSEHMGIGDCLYQIKYIVEIYNQVKNK
jgi:hypothetical protein